MSRGRKKGDHEAKRVEIANAARRVLLRKGLERTSLADIAREVGATTGILRHYFANKDELLLYAKNLIFDRSLQSAAESAARRTGFEKLRAITVKLLPIGEDSIDGYRLLAMFHGNAIGNDGLMRLQDRRNTAHLAFLAAQIVRLQKDKVLRKDVDPRLEAAGILALLDGLAEQMIMRENCWSRKQLLRIVNRYIDGLAAHGGTPQST